MRPPCSCSVTQKMPEAFGHVYALVNNLRMKKKGDHRGTLQVMEIARGCWSGRTENRQSAFFILYMSVGN